MATKIFFFFFLFQKTERERERKRERERERPSEGARWLLVLAPAPERPVSQVKTEGSLLNLETSSSVDAIEETQEGPRRCRLERRNEQRLRRMDTRTSVCMCVRVERGRG